ncbi:threonine ammonia-lyase IlvA [Neptunicoccus cionae]|uniref:L-threonine dehydratase n=1 Tax=Neptunicoccus cionae TaxID=2035344 RepID=A0A916QV72_9RHOB|nr:threonine ammonia-lyase IlvA [Amylibacter cionae]GGA09885.1 L-threonine dehydratase [Amylibacter cionae]
MSDFRDAAQQACAQMRSLFAQTPLQHNAHLSAKYGADIYLKREDLSPVRSYKIRGAFNALRKALAVKPEQKTFVCASAGNHAQGMAFVCRHFDVQGVIFMPVTTPAQKVEKTRIFGGDNVEIILSGDYFDDTLAQAQAYCAEKAAHFLSPFDDEDVIEGQASVAVEIAQEMPMRPDLVVLPVGGGGLSAGITRYYSGMPDAPELLFTEPAGGASLKAALQEGAQVTLPKVNNFVDGAAVARIGDRNFALLKHCSPDQVFPVSEDRLCTTMIEMLNIEGIVLEPAGALSIDVLADIADQIKGKTVVCVSSGGNFDFERLPEVKERAQKFLGLKKYFILRLPQRPGALKDFLGLLGPKDDIARFEYLKKSARNFGTVLIGIETDAPENFIELDRRISSEGFDLRDITNDAAIAEFLI